MKVLVTGGSGAIGEYVVTELKKRHSVTVADRRPPAKNTNVEFREADLRGLDAAMSAVRGCDAVVHLAAIPSPHHGKPDEIMAVNTATAYNVLQASRANGVRKLVYGGSDSGTGFGWHEKAYRPLYLPLDAEHPCWPHESYSFTKWFGELMFMEYSRAFNIPTVSIRFMWVLLDRDREAVSEIQSGKTDRFDWFGSYVMPEDVAQIVALAVDYRIDERLPFPFEAFYVHAAKTFLTTPTLEQAKKIWGTVPPLKNSDYYLSDPYAPFFDIATSRAKLGYQPRYAVGDYFTRSDGRHNKIR